MHSLRFRLWDVLCTGSITLLASWLWWLASDSALTTGSMLAGLAFHLHSMAGRWTYRFNHGERWALPIALPLTLLALALSILVKGLAQLAYHASLRSYLLLVSREGGAGARRLLDNRSKAFVRQQEKLDAKWARRAKQMPAARLPR